MECIKIILSYQQIKNKYMNNHRFLLRLFHVLFISCGDRTIIEYMRNNMHGLDEKMQKLIMDKPVAAIGSYKILNMLAGKANFFETGINENIIEKKLSSFEEADMNDMIHHKIKNYKNYFTL